MKNLIKMKIIRINPARRYSNHFYSLTMYGRIYRPRIIDTLIDTLETLRYLKYIIGGRL